MVTTSLVSESGVVRGGITDALAVFAEIALRTLSKGVIIRRPRVMSLAERMDLDSRA